MADAPIPFSRPYLSGGEPEAVASALAARRWSGDGPATARASALLAQVIGGRVLLTTSCTHALELAALLLDIQPGDEVIVPAFTFVSTANAFALRGAHLVFADVRPDTLNLDERLLPVTARTKAIVPVHYAGVGCAMDAIGDAAASVGASIVEDAAHGLYGTWRGRPLGGIGRLAALSFHETKNITCGEGGAIAIHDPALVARAEILREKGTDRSRYFRGEIDKYTWRDLGSSYLPSDLLAAVLVAQLEAAERIQAARHRVWNAYATGLADWAQRHGIGTPHVPEHCAHPAHLYYVTLPDLARRTTLSQHLRARGITAAFHYQPLHLSSFGQRYGTWSLPVTERAGDTVLRLPLYPELGDHDIARVVDAVTSFTP